MFEVAPDEPYIQGQLEYLLKAVDWAKKYGLKIIIALYGMCISKVPYYLSSTNGRVVVQVLLVVKTGSRHRFSLHISQPVDFFLLQFYQLWPSSRCCVRIPSLFVRLIQANPGVVQVLAQESDLRRPHSPGHENSHLHVRRQNRRRPHHPNYE